MKTKEVCDMYTLKGPGCVVVRDDISVCTSQSPDSGWYTPCVAVRCHEDTRVEVGNPAGLGRCTDTWTLCLQNYEISSPFPVFFLFIYFEPSF